MNAPRWDFEAIELPGGRVLVIDQQPCNPISDLTGPPHGAAPIDVLDLATGRWTPGPALNAPRTGFAAVPLSDGRVLVSGGDNGWWGAYSSTKLFDPAKSAWIAGGLLRTARKGPLGGRLADGRPFVAGGTYSEGYRDMADFERGGPPDERHVSSVEAYDAAADRWAELPGAMDVIDGRAYPRPDGTFLIVSLLDDGRPFEVQLVDSDRLVSRTVGRVTVPLEAAVAVLEDGGLLVAGGLDASSRPTATVTSFDPQTGRTDRLASLPEPRAGALAIRLGDGSILIVGGSTEFSADRPAPMTASALRYDPSQDAWSDTVTMPFASSPGQALVLSDGSVLVMGGSSPPEQWVTDACGPQDPIPWTARYLPENTR
jgi:hypothetical protein